MSTTDPSTTLGSVPFLRAEAQITVTIGSLMVQHLQLAVQLLMDGHDTSTLAQRAEQDAITDPRELVSIGLSGLITAIYRQAQATGQTYMQDITVSDLQ